MSLVNGNPSSFFADSSTKLIADLSLHYARTPSTFFIALLERNENINEFGSFDDYRNDYDIDEKEEEEQGS